MIDAAVGEHDHAGGGVDAAVGGAQHLVDRARVALDRRLGLHVPHDDVERVRAGDHHRRDGLGIVRALVVVDGDQPVHEGAAGDERHVAERAGAHLLLGGEPLAAKALRIADDGVDLGLLDGLQHARGLGEIGRQRLLDQQRQRRARAAARMGATCRCSSVAMMAAVTSGRLQQLAVVLGDEVGADLAADLSGPVGVLLGEPDPLDRGVRAATSPRKRPTRPPPTMASPMPFALRPLIRPSSRARGLMATIRAAVRSAADLMNH